MTGPPESEDGARLIDGRALARETNKATRALALAGSRPPGLGVVLVGDDEASARYVARKGVVAGRLGFVHVQRSLPASCTQAELHDTLDALVADPTLDGVLLQLPLPEGLDEAAALARIPAEKDVDGLHPENLGSLAAGRPGLVPCTAWGVLELVRSTGLSLAGAEAVVVGRSAIVGRPTALLLDLAGATVTVCHRSTRDLASHVRRAELLVVAAGVPELIRGDWIRPGAVVIDVGIHSTASGLVGDVQQDAARARAAAITPVPGGVGPMTIAGLMRNTLRARDQREGPAR